jgi:hypothetical protein
MRLMNWTPAFAGVTKIIYVVIPAKAGIQSYVGWGERSEPQQTGRLQSG